MEYFVISAKFVPLKYYTLSSQLRRLTSFSVGLFGSANSVTRSYPVMRKSCISCLFLIVVSNSYQMALTIDKKVDDSFRRLITKDTIRRNPSFYLKWKKSLNAIHHFRINRSLAGWAHSQRRVGVNITIPLHWPSCEWTLTLPIFLVFVRYQQ